MTPEMLMSEGRRLARPAVFLRPRENGPLAAVWHEPDEDEIETSGFRCWITIDGRFVPALPKADSGFLSVFTDERKCEGGRVEVHPFLPKRPGVNLQASEGSVLPPIEAIFALGSAAVGEWLAANDWPRDSATTTTFQTAPSSRNMSASGSKRIHSIAKTTHTPSWVVGIGLAQTTIGIR